MRKIKKEQHLISAVMSEVAMKLILQIAFLSLSWPLFDFPPTRDNSFVLAKLHLVAGYEVHVCFGKQRNLSSRRQTLCFSK